MIDLDKVRLGINCLEIANKQFLYAKVQPDAGHSAAFIGGQDFNKMKW